MMFQLNDEHSGFFEIRIFLNFRKSSIYNLTEIRNKNNSI